MAKALNMALADDPVTLLNERFASLSTLDMLREVMNDKTLGEMAVVSSFGAESAVLLHLVAQVNSNARVIFVDTLKLFGETLRYRDQLVKLLGLTNVQVVEPDPLALQINDAKGLLWQRDANSCCAIRKVEPLARALKSVDSWISGRKAFQASTRAQVGLFEKVDGKLKINPLAGWTKADLDAYFTAHDLPPHPLVADGYLSIGCMPCTTPVQPGEDARAGRWRGSEKTECGIHGANFETREHSDSKGNWSI
jgi:phosphoadenosine phosphosulfate reductase